MFALAACVLVLCTIGSRFNYLGASNQGQQWWLNKLNLKKTMISSELCFWKLELQWQKLNFRTPHYIMESHLAGLGLQRTVATKIFLNI